MPKLFHIILLLSLVSLFAVSQPFSASSLLWAEDKGNSLGSGEKKEPANNKGPISVSADHMTADDSKRLIVFSGRVVARQGDLIISCDSMRVTYQPVGSYVPPSSNSKTGAPGAGSEASLENAEKSATPASAPGSLPESAGLTESSETPKPASQGGLAASLQGGQEIDKVECEGAVKIQEGERLAVAQKVLYLAKALPRRLVLTGDARVWQGANSITGHQITYYLDENRSLVDSVGSQRVRAFYDQGSRGD
jgi:lipopolysaccharide export system protein LptA